MTEDRANALRVWKLCRASYFGYKAGGRYEIVRGRAIQATKVIPPNKSWLEILRRTYVNARREYLSLSRERVQGE